MVLPHLSSRRMFGRDAELEALQDARRALSGRRGSVVLVGGEPGMGKSRLLGEFAATLRGGRSPHYALGESLEDAPRPFGTWRTALAALVQRVPATLDNAPPLVGRSLAALIPFSVVDRDGLLPPSDRLEKAELFTGVLHYLRLVSEKRATVIALEDLHWADVSSLELLCHVAPRIGGMRLMIVATYRDEALQPQHRLFGAVAKLSRADTVRRILLEPLAERHVRALIDDALGDTYALTDERIRAVLDRCDGNPFFAEELLGHAVQRERGGTSSLPLSIRSLTLDRIAGLSAQTRRL
ncbi:MAG: AAA family ATPase, partial [Candidatus Eremiobacteraeota bacterium]|nr:AAA family ATPase [Candidatus Eremiobacteraeota bacterium]